MNSRPLLSIILLLITLLSSVTSLRAQEGDQYASIWKCSDGNTYGLIADGSRREFYLANGVSPIFFSGVKNGQSYSGTIFINQEQIPVSGPVSMSDTRITLTARDGRTWVLNFSHK